ncbi:hypothetical protein [Anaerovibrio sp. JC8]|uniref:hypothetical protein n=1 Tax=Anaerovibrio sp. JC8 TaxID=1240085 RepID=UPI000A120DA4|nr:hypothetical protein [Anaerovibrio sp. JC8]
MDAGCINITNLSTYCDIPLPKMKEILIAGGVYENECFGHWTRERITKWKKGKNYPTVYWINSFQYDWEKLEKDFKADYMRYKQGVGRSRKAKRFFELAGHEIIREQGI